MKEIKATVRVERVAEVLDALDEQGIKHVTLNHVMALDADPEAKMNIEFGRPASRMVKLEIICLDNDESRVVESIRKAANTQRSGDGIILVSNVNRLVNIHTSLESVRAL